MKKISLVVIGIFIGFVCQSQNMARIVVSACGTSASNGPTTLNYTVGEAVVSYLTSNGSPTYKLSQGYQQSDTVAKGASSGITKVSNFKYVILLPNPANNSISVSSYSEVPCDLSYSIYNSYGQLCLFTTNDRISNGKIERSIDISELASGSYTLKVSSVNSDYLFLKNLPLIIIH